MIGFGVGDGVVEVFERVGFFYGDIYDSLFNEIKCGLEDVEVEFWGRKTEVIKGESADGDVSENEVTGGPSDGIAGHSAEGYVGSIVCECF